LASHFHRGIYVNLWGSQWKHEETFPLKLFSEEKPQLVIMQFKESRLGFCGRPYCITSPKRMTNPDDVRQARLRKLYRESGSAEVQLETVKPVDGSHRQVRYVLDMNPLPETKQGIWLIKVDISGNKKQLMLAVESEKKSQCRHFKEVEHVRLKPAQHSAILCVDARKKRTGMVRLVMKSVAGQHINLKGIVARPHTDIPKKGYWKQKN